MKLPAPLQVGALYNQVKCYLTWSVELKFFMRFTTHTRNPTPMRLKERWPRRPTTDGTPWDSRGCSPPIPVDACTPHMTKRQNGCVRPAEHLDALVDSV